MQVSKALSVRVRMLFAVGSVCGLLFLLHRIHTKELLAAFDAIHWIWFVLAVVAFGCVFVPAAARWRVALHASGASVGLGPAVRISLIGHFFYTILFGAVGGDTAKSLLYSRWNQVPLTKTLSASSVDRLLGFGGLILFLAVAFALGLVQGGFARLGTVSLRWPFWSLVGLVLLVTVIAAWLKRSSAGSFQRQFVGTLSGTIRTLLKKPSDFAAGLLCAILVQAALSGVLAFCLAAVASGPVPWLKMAWTFPLISIISALPITFAGLGVRDSAAVVLFGFYQIPSSNAVAASLLAAAVSLVWAAIGGGLLWREAWRNESKSHLRDVFALVSR